MKIHEYQAKQILREYGIPVPRGRAASTPDEAREAAEALHGKNRRQGADPRGRTGQRRRRQTGGDAG